MKANDTRVVYWGATDIIMAANAEAVDMAGPIVA